MSFFFHLGNVVPVPFSNAQGGMFLLHVGEAFDLSPEVPSVMGQSHWKPWENHENPGKTIEIPGKTMEIPGKTMEIPGKSMENPRKAWKTLGKA